MFAVSTSSSVIVMWSTDSRSNYDLISFKLVQFIRSVRRKNCTEKSRRYKTVALLIFDKVKNAHRRAPCSVVLIIAMLGIKPGAYPMRLMAARASSTLEYLAPASLLPSRSWNSLNSQNSQRVLSKKGVIY